MTHHQKPLSWKAVRRGAIYCAPGCGGRCTWAQYQHAKKSAAALAKRCGKGWKGHVWENVGWHWKAIGPDGSDLYEHNPFWCSLVVPGLRQFNGEGTTPKKAIQHARAQALRALGQLQALSLSWEKAGDP